MHRRQFCRWLGLAGAMSMVGCLGDRTESPGGTATDTPDPQPAGWPTFGFDHQHTGVRDEGHGPETGTVAWKAIGDAPTVLCSPTVTDGTVFTGSAATAVHAFDTVTGEQRWEYDTQSYVETAPAVVNDTVYTADADGIVYALNMNGEPRWTYETDHNLHSRAVAVHDGTLIVGTAGTMPGVVSGETDKSKAGLVVGLDTDTGKEQWSFQGPEDWFSGPAVGAGRVYVGNHTGAVFALDADSGEEVWSWTPTGGHAEHAAVLAPPTYADGTVYVGLHAAGWLVALDATSGDLRWRRNLEAENVKSSPAVTDKRVYIGSTRARAVPAAQERTNDTETSTPSGTPTPEPGTYGKLYALSKADGSTVWMHETEHDFRSSPAVVGDRVYIGGGDGALAVTRDDGSEVWQVSFDDFVDSSPAVADGRLYIGSADGHLYCIGDG